MDPITDLFFTTQVGSVVHARLEATAPWGLSRDEEVSAPGHPASRYAHFGLIARGHCWLSVPGYADSVSLCGGDSFLLAPGSSYSLRDDPHTQARSFCEIAPKDGSQVVEYGGGGAKTTVVCGWFQFDPGSIKLLERLLPPMIVVRADQTQSLALHTTINMLASELAESAPGSDLMVHRLADMLFIHCIRSYVESRSEKCNNGLLKAIFHPQIGAAIRTMHEKVDAPWTVESLAAASGMSRSAFAAKFKELVGETPLEYLTNWRMQKATALLRKGEQKLVDVAKTVGYDSDAAFSKAFKRIVGMAPREYGRQAAVGD